MTHKDTRRLLTQDDMSQMSAGRAALAQRVTNVETSVIQMQGSVNTTNSLYSDLAGRMTMTEIDVLSIQQGLSGHNTRLNTLETDISPIKSWFTDKAANIAKLGMVMSGIGVSIAGLIGIQVARADALQTVANKVDSILDVLTSRGIMRTAQGV